MKKISIICPICSKFKRIEVPSYIFEIDEGSLLKFPIKAGTMCKHSFIVILDYHFKVRDYEIPTSIDEIQQYYNKINHKKPLALFQNF